MAKLQRFLELLERPDVRELVLQSNTLAAVRTDAGMRAVSRQVLTLEVIHALVRETALERLVQSNEPHQTGSFELEGRVYAARIASFGDRLQIRIARSAARKRVGPDSSSLSPAPHTAVGPRPTSDPRQDGGDTRWVLREHRPPGAGPSLPAARPGDDEDIPSFSLPPPEGTGEPSAAPAPAASDRTSSQAPGGASPPGRRPVGSRAGSVQLARIALSSVPVPRAPSEWTGAVPRPRAAVIESLPSPAAAQRPASVDPRSDLPGDDEDLPPVLCVTAPPPMDLGALGIPPTPTFAPATSSAPPAPARSPEPSAAADGAVSIRSRPSGEFRLPDWISSRRPRAPETRVDLSVSVLGVPDPMPPEAAPVPASVEPSVLPPATSDGERALRELVARARALNATDLIVATGRPPHARRRAGIEPIGDALSHESVQELAAVLLTPSELGALASFGHVDSTVDLGEHGRLRVNVCRQRAGLKCAVRLVPLTPAMPADLGLPAELSRGIEERQGLIIAASPAGQGKSTTVASLVHAVNVAHAVRIVTVESRIEIVHPRRRALISQREVETHATSAVAALRAALREDPDLIAIDELVDVAAIEMALTAAQTGHLVVAAVNAPNGQRAIERLIERFPRHHHGHVRAQLAGVLKLVTAQRLLRDAAGTGLVPAVEVISGGLPLWALIRDDQLFQLPALLRRGRAIGMVSLADAIEELVRTGRVAAQDAEPWVVEPPEGATTSRRLLLRPNLRTLLEGER